MWHCACNHKVTGKKCRSLTAHLENKMRPNPKTLRIASKVLLYCAAVLLFSALPVRAESYLSGTYRCTTVEIGGKSAPCKAPSLILKSDGSFRMLSETGTYEIVEGHWLILSAAKRHGRARLDGSKEIIFTFLSGGKKSRIIYRRKYQRPDGWVAS
jgi:hypothetical protein